MEGGLLEDLKRGDHLQVLGVRRMILEWMLVKYVGCGLDASGSRWGQVVDPCKHGGEPSC
jgi:hypothetical protein